MRARSDLDSLTKLTAYVLYFHMADDGSCWPSVDAVAREAGMDRRTARARIRHLRDLGCVDWDEKSGNRSRRYRAVEPASHGSSRDPSQNGHGSSRDPSHGSSRAPHGSPGDPEPSITIQKPSTRRSSDAPKAKRQRRDAARQQAEAVVNDWWETQTPRPTAPWIAVVKVAATALRNGWQPDDLRAALEAVPVVSGAALDLWRNTRRPSTPQTPADWLPNGGALTTERTG